MEVEYRWHDTRTTTPTTPSLYPYCIHPVVCLTVKAVAVAVATAVGTLYCRTHSNKLTGIRTEWHDDNCVWMWMGW